MTSDVKVYISMKDATDRRLTVDGSMAMVIDILRELGREVIAERERQAAATATEPPAAPAPSPPQTTEDSQQCVSHK